MPFIVIQPVLPIGQVGRQVDLIGSPEGRHMLLVHDPQIVVFDGEQGEPRSVVYGTYRLYKTIIGGNTVPFQFVVVVVV